VQGGGYCPRHASKPNYDRNRKSSADRGYGYRWRKARAAFIQRNPLCRECEKEDRVTATAEVDHIIPVTGPDDPRFWDEGNWQPLCKPHHSRKTATENGGFGH